MRTLVLSDLHLGSASRADLLRREELRAPLLELASQVDRVVLLGDVLELRHGPPREALAVARPFFEELGQALAGRELVLVAGNHDHALIEPWLAMRAELAESRPLGLEQLIEPAEASPMVERLADWAAPARVRFAYPGLWLRPDVYAMHGHYLDCHLTVPTIERLSVGVMSRLMGRPAATFERVGDYEAVTAPMYAWRHAVARDARTGDALNGMGTVHAWRVLSGSGEGRNAARNGARADARTRLAAVGANLRRRALVHGFPLAVAALNRAGLGPLNAEVSSGELRGAGLRAMSEVAARLGLGDAYVVFGHTHRAGPLPGDDAGEWVGRHQAGGSPSAECFGARLVNVGCWTYDSIFLTRKRGESPYWPGTCALIGDDGPPELRRLLLDRDYDELSPVRRRVSA
ncbi:MAG TPA: metallophosphoesterase [Solirubrobacteraceae bacterium]|nr:metallophosphoesterase [Solirubrobacteraceae bacterium]